MQCFQKLQPVSAISFDLDDTLYDNYPILIAAEAALQQWLAREFPHTAAWDVSAWRECKRQQFSLQPELQHDTSAARVATLNAGLLACGYDAATAQQGAAQGLALFSRERSNFRVSETVVQLLAELKQRYHIIGITNGNVDHQRIGLGAVFDEVIHPGHGVRMKPYRDMFDIAASKLQLPLTQLLHVGDNATTDVDGARRVGAQAVWLAPAFGRTTVAALGQRLPHWQISDISELRQLLLS